MSTESAIQALTQRFPDIAFDPRPLLVRPDGSSAGQICIAVPPDRLLQVMTFLRDDPRAAFDQLSDLSCVDYLRFPGARDRYGVIYSLLSLAHGHRLWAKVYLNDPDPEVPSVTSVWKSADWMEREVYDMFGVRFAGHPDLRRILTWDGFQSYPLRKDYPLRGKGEREDYPVLTRESS